jgi:hypothetical protein
MQARVPYAEGDAASDVWCFHGPGEGESERVRAMVVDRTIQRGDRPKISGKAYKKTKRGKLGDRARP